MRNQLSQIFSIFLFTFLGLACISYAQIYDKCNIYPIKIKEKYGYVDSSGKVVINPIFDGADFFCRRLGRSKSR